MAEWPEIKDPLLKFQNTTTNLFSASDHPAVGTKNKHPYNKQLNYHKHCIKKAVTTSFNRTKTGLMRKSCSSATPNTKGFSFVFLISRAI